MFAKNKFFTIVPAIFSLAFTAVNAKATDSKEIESARLEELEGESGKIDIEKVSKAFGHLIGKNLDSLGFDFDMKNVIRGLEECFAGKESPMSENECVQAISLVQEESFQKLSKKNLQEADAFMTKNAREGGVKEIEKNKLQYKIEQTGNGVIVEEHFSPMIRYTGKFLDGKVFGASQEDEMISLDETIPGFSKGIVGMKEGEKRTIYIHPDLGYGTSGYLPPNSLLVFDIELVKANAAPAQEESVSSLSDQGTKEIALPDEGTAIR